MRILRYTPLAQARSLPPVFAHSPWAGLEAEMDRLFQTALEVGPVTPTGGFPVDLYEDDHATYVRAELPGVDRADLGVELVEGVLHLSATRRRTEAGEEATLRLSRTLTVPEGSVQADKIGAVYENGVLTVTLPKREESKPRKITVAVA